MSHVKSLLFQPLTILQVKYNVETPNYFFHSSVILTSLIADILSSRPYLIFKYLSRSSPLRVRQDSRLHNTRDKITIISILRHIGLLYFGGSNDYLEYPF
jgi:hypothetical protein